MFQLVETQSLSNTQMRVQSEDARFFCFAPKNRARTTTGALMQIGLKDVLYRAEECKEPTRLNAPQVFDYLYVICAVFARVNY